MDMFELSQYELSQVSGGIAEDTAGNSNQVGLPGETDAQSGGVDGLGQFGDQGPV